ncbi:hypothetical protein [Vibrio sp. D431a]|uniref:hypothetical protein n=1 Tax=Vibrio sp. D431a TaxID=2837388 RepID=UPI002556C0B7|nr:hypothetical protein [Vibrio sp. D431a]MDK9789770.1 hypothetical protein [Vibrio sp. D431a]
MKKLKHYTGLISSRLYSTHKLFVSDGKQEQKATEFQNAHKAIKTDCLMLWKPFNAISKNNETSTLGLSFEYLGVDEALIQISFSTDSTAPKYSTPYKVKEYRDLIKTLTKSNNANGTDFINAMVECFIEKKFDDDRIKEALSQRDSLIEMERNTFKGFVDSFLSEPLKLIGLLPEANKDMKEGLDRVQKLLSQTSEFAEYQKALSALKEAEIKLNARNDALINEDKQLLEARAIVDQCQGVVAINGKKKMNLSDYCRQQLQKGIDLVITEDSTRTRVRMKVMERAFAKLLEQLEGVIHIGCLGDTYTIKYQFNSFKQSLKKARKN